MSLFLKFLLQLHSFAGALMSVAHEEVMNNLTFCCWRDRWWRKKVLDPWAGDLTFLSFSFFICQVRVIFLLFHGVVEEVYVKVLLNSITNYWNVKEREGSGESPKSGLLRDLKQMTNISVSVFSSVKWECQYWPCRSVTHIRNNKCNALTKW